MKRSALTPSGANVHACDDGQEPCVQLVVCTCRARNRIDRRALSLTTDGNVAHLRVGPA